MTKNRMAKLQPVGSAEGSAPEQTPGKVTHDARGNAVWNLDIFTGVFNLATEHDRVPDWSGDPYNRTNG